VATYDRFLKLREKADEVDSQRLFGSFLDLVEGLGWRVSAICRLWASDVDLQRTAIAPHGRIRKREENDKTGVEMWVPLSKETRAAVERVLNARQVVGDVWLFPAASRRRAGQPWDRHHAKELLNRATAAAKLEPLAGGDFHPFRRKWVTERKQMPLVDVAAAGGWKDPNTLLRSYARPDDATLLAVVTSPQKLREVGER
jgi:integrase